MKKVFKYGTGHEIPEGAEYLYTRVEIVKELKAGPMTTRYVEVEYVWHYFLVEC